MEAKISKYFEYNYYAGKDADILVREVATAIFKVILEIEVDDGNESKREVYYIREDALARLLEEYGAKAKRNKETRKILEETEEVVQL